MITRFVYLRKTLVIFGLCLTAFVPVQAAPAIANTTKFASGTAVSATAPDSIAIRFDGVWVAYTNGADSTGASGHSVVAQYDFTGNLLNQYTVPGYVDGLKYDDERGLIWVLVNQDGNSALMFIDLTGKMSSSTYAVTSGTRGFDDVAFINGAIFMSYTNPSAPTDVIIEYMTGISPVSFAPVLTEGATGTNLVTQQAGQAITMTDPDSLKSTPYGGLMMSGAADGQIVFVHDLAKATRSVGFINILDPTSGKNVVDLDDAVFVTSPKGSFYVADGKNNQVLKVDVTGMVPMSLYASVGSLNAVASVDLTTGKATPFITGLSGPHGLAFVENFNSLFGPQPH